MTVEKEQAMNGNSITALPQKSDLIHDLDELGEQMRRVAVRMIWEKNYPEHAALGKRAEQLYGFEALVEEWMAGLLEAAL